jgi:quercetin dioxygenase-like cupin family protein
VIWSAAAGSHLVSAGAATPTDQNKIERARVTFSHDLPRLNRANLTVTTVKVNYGPGESSTPHSHPCPVIGYVVEGTLRTKVKGEPEAIYKAGASFYEAPNGIHLISANASDKERAKLLAFFVCDPHTSLSVDAPQNKPAGEK